MKAATQLPFLRLARPTPSLHLFFSFLIFCLSASSSSFAHAQSCIRVSAPAGYFASTTSSAAQVEVPGPPPGSLTYVIPASSTVGEVPPNTERCWLISPDPAQRDEEQRQPIGTIFLNFHSFNVKAGDVVEVYEGDEENAAALLGEFTQDNVPVSIKTVTEGIGQMLVVFRTGSTQQGSSFGVYFQAGACAHGIHLLTQAHGWIEDGSGPENPYANRRQCGYLIAPANRDETARVSVTFTQLVLESGFDWAFIYNGPDETYPLIEAFTGALTAANESWSDGEVEKEPDYEGRSSTVVGTRGALYLLFSHDKTINEPGWRFEYSITSGAFCSGTTTFTSSSATFSDMSGVENYEANTECSWLIKPEVPVGSISLYFNEFDLASGSSLSIYAGSSADADLLEVLKGNKLPPFLNYDGDELFLVFSGGSSTAQGFTAIYHAGRCVSASRLNSASGLLVDGSGSRPYRINMDCQWVIELDESIYEYIFFNFTHFDIEFRFDQVSVYGGLDTSDSPLLLSYSGFNQTPPAGRCNGGKMLVTFKADADTIGSGWELYFEGVPFEPPTFVYPSYDESETITVVVLLMTAAFFAFVFFIVFSAFINKKVVRNTGRVYNLLLLVLLFLACFTIYPFLDDPSDSSCAARPWMMVAYFMVVGLLTGKIYAIWFQQQRRKKNERSDLLYLRNSWFVMGAVLAVVMIVELLFLILWSSIDAPIPTLTDTETDGEVYERCESEDGHMVWAGFQIGLVGILLIAAVIGAIRIYFIPVMWSESTFLSMSVGLLCASTVIFIGILFAVQDTPSAWVLVLGIGIWWHVFIVLACVFGTRFYFLVRSLQSKKKANTAITTADATIAEDDGLDDL
ncbi:hypothetical protein QOT17_001341 [Balamuthia mandrillaris]